MVPERADVLKAIADMLAAGLKTEVEPFPETDKEFGDILLKLRQLDPDDLEGKLVIGGFVDHCPNLSSRSSRNGPAGSGAFELRRAHWARQGVTNSCGRGHDCGHCVREFEPKRRRRGT